MEVDLLLGLISFFFFPPSIAEEGERDFLGFLDFFFFFSEPPEREGLELDFFRALEEDLFFLDDERFRDDLLELKEGSELDFWRAFEREREDFFLSFRVLEQRARSEEDRLNSGSSSSSSSPRSEGRENDLSDFFLLDLFFDLDLRVSIEIADIASSSMGG